MISAQGGIFGSVTDSDTFVRQLEAGSVDEPISNGVKSNSEVAPAVNVNATVPAPPPETPPNLFIEAKPYKWPYNGNMTPQNTCIIVIDMQVDFCAK
jgi:hypothetical protein